ncbi:hypothetical protein MPER_12936 [Moniliophthora perniciosa FA553]|nr:hypothetical protein MPER_12936 [Moniliophthora perniciosa FA553]
MWVKLARTIYVNDLETAAFSSCPPLRLSSSPVLDTPPISAISSYNHFCCLPVDKPLSEDETDTSGSTAVDDSSTDSGSSPLPSPPSSSLHTPQRPRWERRLPESFKIAATSSKNSLEIPVELQCTESSVLRATPGFIDCGATDKFIDKDYAKSNGFVLRPLSCPIHVYNVDGTPNHLGKQTVLLGYSWLEKHNPEINWQTKEVKMSRCPRVCTTCRDEVRQEAKLRRAEARRARKWNAQPWPTFTEDLDSEDDCALYLDDEGDSDTDRDPSVGVDALEEEDCILACNLRPNSPAHHINATSTVSQRLAEAAAKDHQAKSSLRDNLPKQFWEYEDVFSKESFDHLPEHRS